MQKWDDKSEFQQIYSKRPEYTTFVVKLINTTRTTTILYQQELKQKGKQGVVLGVGVL